MLFYAEAAKDNVLPLDNSRLARVDVSIRPSLTRGRSDFAYLGPLRRMPEGAAPDVKNKSFRITADLVLPQGSGEGIVVTQGGLSAGYALIFRDGRPVFHYNLAKLAHFEIAAAEAVPPGNHRVVLDFTYDGGRPGRGGTGVISIDGRQVAQGRIERTIPLRFSLDETFDVGEDTGTPVNEMDNVPFRFTGEIGKVEIRLGEGSSLTSGKSP